MSARVQSYVWQYSQHKGTELLTLLAIADSAHDDGMTAAVLMRDLERKTRMSERHVRRVIRNLEKSLELHVLQRKGVKKANVFKVLMHGDILTGDVGVPGHLDRGRGCPLHAPIEGIDKRVSDPEITQDPDLNQREESIDKNLCFPGARNASVSPPGQLVLSNGLATPAPRGKIKPLAEDDWLRALLLDYEQLDFRYLNDDGWWIDISQALTGRFSKDWLNSEFGKASAYLRENPKKKPASSQGWKRFIRSWLHRSFEHERRFTSGNTPRSTSKRY